MTALHSRRMKTDAPYFRQWHSSAQNKPKPREFLFTTESIVENNSRFSLRLGRTWNIVWPGKIRCQVFDCTKKTICPPSLRYHPPSLHFSWASSSFDNFIALSDSADCASITHNYDVCYDIFLLLIQTDECSVRLHDIVMIVATEGNKFDKNRILLYDRHINQASESSG